MSVIIVLAAWTYCFGLGPFDVFPVARGLDGAVAAYRQAGLPFEAKDLAPNPPIPDTDNAAFVLNEALGAPNDREIAGIISHLRIYAHLGNWQKASALLRANQATLELLHQAAGKPRLDFGWDWDMAPLLEQPVLDRALRGIELVTLEARINAGLGRVDLCYSEIEAAWKLSSLIGQEPCDLALLTQVEGDRLTLDALQSAAVTLHGNAAALRSLRSVFAIVQAAKFDLMHSLLGEAYEALSLARNGHIIANHMATGKTDPAELNEVARKLIRSGVPDELYQRAALDQSLIYWTQIKQEADADGDDPDQIGTAMQRLTEQAMRSQSLSAKMLFRPTFSETVRAIRQPSAYHAVTVAFLSALQVQATTGRFPTTIEAVPGAPSDPYDAQRPLKLGIVPGGIKIYSVGPDGVDNGGALTSDDIVARFPASE